MLRSVKFLKSTLDVQIKPTKILTVNINGPQRSIKTDRAFPT